VVPDRQGTDRNLVHLVSDKLQMRVNYGQGVIDSSQLLLWRAARSKVCS
jgi:hypothetical protein